MTSYEEPATDQIHIRALKFENLSFEEKLTHWKGCVATRLNSLNNEEAKGKAITVLWPMYKEPSGYRLV